MKINRVFDIEKEESINIDLNDIIIDQTILYGKPAVLFRHSKGYAWKYDGRFKDLGNVTKERALEKFRLNF